MITSQERRHSERARIPCNIPVELTAADRGSQFEADAVDLSVGGLSLRAARLPDLGSLLFCSFAAMPGGAQVLGRGEVVWRQETGDEGGEFGLRFVEVDARNQALIDEMVAERIARIDTPFTQLEPVIASLEIENVNSPMAARLVHNGETEALFEQTLDHWAVGKAVVAHAGVSLLRGNVAALSLRMEGTTPMLAIKLQLTRDSAGFGEFEWGEPGSDTDPDVFAHGRRDSGEIETESDEDADESDEESDDDEQDDGQDEDEGLPSALEHSATVATLPGFGGPMPAPILARVDEKSRQLPLLFRRDGTPGSTEPDLGALRLSLGDHDTEQPDRVFADEEHAMQLLTEAAAASEELEDEKALQPSHDEGSSQPVPDETANAPLVRVLRVFAALSELVQRTREGLQGFMLKLQHRAAPRIAGASRGMFGGRPRKVTAVSARTQRETTTGQPNKLAMGAIVVAAITLLASVLVPLSSDMIPRHKSVLPEQPDSAETDAAEGGAQLVSANPAAQLGGANSGAPEAEGTGSQPGNSPYAVDTRNKNAASKAFVSSSTAFGQKQVPNSRRFVLRMASPVTKLQGKSEPGGFSVIIAGNKAIDRAAPLKAQASVQSAGILNRKDFAELHVRFAPGKSPAYRVSADGASLEVLIGP